MNNKIIILKGNKEKEITLPSISTLELLTNIDTLFDVKTVIIHQKHHKFPSRITLKDKDA